MKRFMFILFIFCLSLSIPLGYFIVRTYISIEQEEFAELRFFADSLFDEIENELSILVIREENRSINDYNNLISNEKITSTSDHQGNGVLADTPLEPFILGYFQNNPDGSFQSPLLKYENRAINPKTNEQLKKLQSANLRFNKKKQIPTTYSPIVLEKTTDNASHQEESLPQQIQEADTENKQIEGEQSSIAQKYFVSKKEDKKKDYLGQSQNRLENLTKDQLQNLLGQAEEQAFSGSDLNDSEDVLSENMELSLNRSSDSGMYGSSISSNRLEIEVAPLQSILIDQDQVFIFRRIMIGTQVYRQGFIIYNQDFMNYIVEKFFIHQPMARFTNLNLKILQAKSVVSSIQAGARDGKPIFNHYRQFPRPFSFLDATLSCSEMPKTPGRRTLNIMIVALPFIFVVGIFSIYQSVRAQVKLSERRTHFVSSVTHELKTPLTNIRMYVDMLEQGIAHNEELEQEYFRVLGSESSRLSALIDNVLEYSKVENQKKHAQIIQGDFDDVIQKIKDVLQEKLNQEGFQLLIKRLDSVSTGSHKFLYDHEMMVQVMINLIENCVKFGKSSKRKEIHLELEVETLKKNELGHMCIRIIDFGPGIPHKAINKVFKDFYRANSPETTSTGGTGIGLALVKKFMKIMGGSVSVENNTEAGCTFTLRLPLSNDLKTEAS